MGILDKLKNSLDEAQTGVNKLAKGVQKSAEDSGLTDRLQGSLEQAQSALETAGREARDGLQRINDFITNQVACSGCEAPMGANEATWQVPLDLREVGERLCWDCVEARGLERLCQDCQEVSLPLTRELPFRTLCSDCSEARVQEAEAQAEEARARSEEAWAEAKEGWRDYTRNVTNCTDDELRGELEKLLNTPQVHRGRHYGGRRVDFFVLCDELAGYFNLKGTPPGAVRILHDEALHAVVGGSTVVLFHGAPDDFHAKYFTLDAEMYAMIGFMLSPVAGLAGGAWTRHKMTKLIEWVDDQIGGPVEPSPALPDPS